jgi:ribonuclease HI
MYVVIESDSEKVIEIMMGRARKWEKDGWKTQNGSQGKHKGDERSQLVDH